ncbi:MAG: hypothetical protein ACFFB0_04965 [Promethearchaeota archaeon]
MTGGEEKSHLFDEKIRKYEEKLVEVLLDIGKSKRANPKMATISCYLLIHEKLTQKELKELTGFSMGTISTYLSVMVGTGNFQKIRIPRTHKFMYSIFGELEALPTRALDFALSSIGSIEIYLKSKVKILKKLAEQTKEGAKHLLLRIEELIESFEIYKKIFPPNGILDEMIQKQSSIKPSQRIKNEQNKAIEIKFDEEVYLIEDDIINQLLTSPMFSTRDPMFIRILGYFMTRKYLTQETLKRITGLSSGKISEEVNRLLDDKIINKADISPKGKITYSADSFIILRFARYIINKMTKWVREIENMKLELEKNKSDLEDLDGYTQIDRIYDFILDAIQTYTQYRKKLDSLLEI